MNTQTESQYSNALVRDILRLDGYNSNIGSYHQCRVIDDETYKNLLKLLDRSINKHFIIYKDDLLKYIPKNTYLTLGTAMRFGEYYEDAQQMESKDFSKYCWNLMLALDKETVSKNKIVNEMNHS